MRDADQPPVEPGAQAELLGPGRQPLPGLLVRFVWL